MCPDDEKPTTIIQLVVLTISPHTTYTYIIGKTSTTCCKWEIQRGECFENIYTSLSKKKIACVDREVTRTILKMQEKEKEKRERERKT